MKKEKSIVGVIPARGGSKSIPLKNIKELCGKPLLAYTIESAFRSKTLDHLYVSTDHEQIADVARYYGADVIDRPPELATDESITETALFHALEVIPFNIDIVMTLQPTSPFRSSATIDRCKAIFDRSDADSVIGVVETRNSHGKIKGDKFEYLLPDQPHRRQDKIPLYEECGVIYGTLTQTLQKNGNVRGNRLHALVVDRLEAIDIDEPIDFEIAQALMKKRRRYGESYQTGGN